MTNESRANVPKASVPKASVPKRWIVESLGDETAAVEVDGGAVAHVPRWLLPADAHEGDVLAVTHAHGHGRVTVTVAHDAAATQAALDDSARQMRDAPIDRGGDVAL